MWIHRYVYSFSSLSSRHMIILSFMHHAYRLRALMIHKLPSVLSMI